MKPLFFTISFLFLLIPSVFADVKTYNMDLNNDGKKEVITSEDKFDTEAEGIITVLASDNKLIGNFSMSDHLDKVEFISLNKDGLKQIAAWSYGGAHYTNIAIYGYKGGKLYKIFENGSACGIETDFKAKKPRIKVGSENWGKKDWCYADEPLWKVYVWNGKEFIYDKKLSSAAEISENEEAQRFLNKAHELIEKKNDNKLIYISHGKYEDYYHIKFTLTPDNTLLKLKGYDKYGTSKYEFSDGLFEIFIPKDKFPIPAPNCREYIILRMPMTMDDVSQKEKYIAEKKSLFEKIKNMKEAKSGNIDVVIELNPYITVKNKNPLTIELTGSNVFFREAGGCYINYVGQLQSKEAISENVNKP